MDSQESSVDQPPPKIEDVINLDSQESGVAPEEPSPLMAVVEDAKTEL